MTGSRGGSGGWVLSTPKGDVRAEIVVNAAGQWSRGLGRLAGVDLPIVPLQHHYVVTEPIPEIAGRERRAAGLPRSGQLVLRRQEDGGLLIGPFERNPLTWALDGIPEGFHGRLLPPNLEQIEDYLLAAGERIPAFGDVGIKTVDQRARRLHARRPLPDGPGAGRRDMFVLAGFSIFGIVFGGGAGDYAAEWIVDGQPSDNMWELDVRRFGDYATLDLVRRRARVRGVRGRVQDPLPRGGAAGRPPAQDRPALRPAAREGRRHGRALRLGAAALVRAGRAEGRRRVLVPARQLVRRGRRGVPRGAVGVGVLDQTSFAKFVVCGPGAEALLDRLCANRLPTEPGRMALTQMLTPKGGIECDVTVTRLERRALLRRLGRGDRDARPRLDRAPSARTTARCGSTTSLRATACSRSPARARASCSSGCPGTDVSREAFPFFRRATRRGRRGARSCLRVSYVGELGFELHHPIEQQRTLYDLLFEAGEDLGLVDFGYRALESMRLEKAYRLWGADMSADYSPLEAGLERFVAFDKGDFIGRDALLRAARRRRAADPPRLPRRRRRRRRRARVRAGLRAAGELVAYVMAGGYGHTVGQSIALAYLPIELGERSGPSSRSRSSATVERRASSAQPLYDPRTSACSAEQTGARPALNRSRIRPVSALRSRCQRPAGEVRSDRAPLCRDVIRQDSG